MPVDWEEFDREIDSIIESSAGATDNKLASHISSITRMTDEEVLEMFPDSADVKKLTKLMKIVKSGENRNVQINRIVSNAEEFGGIVLALLQKFA
jgi:hypothetical protein